MKPEIYFGNLKECIYAGYTGNFFGVDHDRILEKGIYVIKINENEYMRLEELFSNKKKKTTIKNTATKKGDIFIDDLILVNELVESLENTKKFR